ncbi:MAG: hypothetical protein A2418_00205 [Candidatus Brennerbacteria bacterium RIFOXYC1_FULL_41_11]|nr:MAG: hypothetical protein A2418_00205 [Candidatus Brennerbacteria bacterium RIFOXYC1_FULL_41_11]
MIHDAGRPKNRNDQDGLETHSKGTKKEKPTMFTVKHDHDEPHLEQGFTIRWYKIVGDKKSWGALKMIQTVRANDLRDYSQRLLQKEVANEICEQMNELLEQ